MGAASREFRTGTTEIDRPVGPDTDQSVADVLEDIAKTLWPKHTAANLAARIILPNGKHPDTRTVERYFEGSREWSGDAIAAIVSEILKRHQMRNVRVTARKT